MLNIYNVKTINSFRDIQREKIRQEKLKAFQETGIWPKSQGNKRSLCKQTESWSLSKQRKLERKSKREKRKNKKLQDTGTEKKKKKTHFTQEDIDELAKDIDLIKKLKKKKVRSINI